MRQIPNSTAVIAVDTAAERIGVISGSAIVLMGDPPTADSPLDFGTCDISGGAASSDVATALWDVTADGGNTTAEGFKLWLLAADNGMSAGSSVCDYEALSGDDQGTPSSTENYIVSATASSYTGNAMPATEPAQNLWPSDEGTSMALSTTSDDAIFFAIWWDIAAGETTGTYEAADSGYELRFSYEFSYS